MDYIICPVEPADWPQMERIYQEGIDTKIATFEREVPGWEKWHRERVQACRLVAKSGDTVLGWAALSQYSHRQVYSGVAEISIYIGKQYRGKKIGENLLDKLIEVSEEHGFWTLQSTILFENVISLKLHKKCGFREVGIRKKLARTDDGIWHDVVLVERRSPIIE